MNGIHYGNDSATDFGVNVTNFTSPSPGEHRASLRGFAYGANIGWINFENTGDPHLNLVTGELGGFAYGANVGWIDLGESSQVTISTSLRRGVDRDGDGLADGYEFTHAESKNLNALGAEPADADNDGESDLAEYLADTDPLDPSSRLKIIAVTPAATAGDFELTFTSRPTRIYHLEGNGLLSGNWEEVFGRLTPLGATTETTVSRPSSEKGYFWRATADLPLQP